MNTADKYQGIVNTIWNDDEQKQRYWMYLQDRWGDEAGLEEWQEYHDAIKKNLIPGTEEFGEFKATTQSPVAGIIFEIEDKLLLFVPKRKANGYAVLSGQFILNIADYMRPTLR